VQELQNGRNGSRVCMVREDLSTKDSGENFEQKVSIDRVSPENGFFSVRHLLQDKAARGRIITNSNALCYDVIPLCKELI
jgi:hypothetical protein